MDQVRIRVRMDHSGADYEDKSEVDLTIEGATVPAASEYGMITMTVLVLAAATLILFRRGDVGSG